MSDIVVTSALRASLSSLQQIQRGIANTSLRLATGKKVNSALENPQSFFTSLSLKARAADYNRVLDGINQSLFTIREGMVGVVAAEQLLKQALSVANESRILAAAGLPDPNVYESGSPDVATNLSTEILAANPAGYWRLDEAAGVVAANQGSGGGINGTYVNGPTLGQPPLYINGGGTSASFNGINQRVNIPDSGLINVGARPQRTVEMVFNATTTVGRQVLYEEGATVNSLGIYIDNGRVYVEGRDAGAWGPVNMSAPINPNETYHIAFVFDQTTDSFTGYLNGVQISPSASVANQVFPSHTGNVYIGATGDGMWFHDGAFGGNGFYFNGRISDVALYNTALTQAELVNHYDQLNLTGGLEFRNSLFERVLAELDSIVKDAEYGNINLLGEENLLTVLNEDYSHTLTTRGRDLTAEGLGIKFFDFTSEGEILQIMQSVDDALFGVRDFARDLSTDLNILVNRRDFSELTIASHKAGSDDLTLADLNEEGANLLALQTQQELATNTLSLAEKSQAEVLRLF